MGHALDDVEAEAGALDVADIGPAFKRFEDAGAVVFRDADALVLDAQRGLGRSGRQRDGDGRAGGRIAHRIAEQVGDDVMEQVQIGGESGHFAGDVKIDGVGLAVAEPNLLDEGLHLLLQVGRREVHLDAVRIHAIEEEHLVQHLGHAVQGGGDSAEELPAFGRGESFEVVVQQFHRAQGRGHRRAKLMRGDGNEAGLHLGDLALLLQHGGRLGLEALARRDVADEDDTFIRPDRGGAELGDQRAGGEGHFGLGNDGGACLDGIGAGGQGGLQQRGGQVGAGPGGQCGRQRRQRRRPFGGPKIDQRSVAVQPHHQIRDGFQQRLDFAVARGEFLGALHHLLFELDVEALELGAGLLLQGDVADRGDREELSIPAETPMADLDGKSRSVRPAVPLQRHIVGDPLVRGKLPAIFSGGVRFGGEVFRLEGEETLDGIAVALGRRLIGQGDAAGIGGVDENGIRLEIEELPEALFALPQGVFAPLAFGDITGDAEQVRDPAGRVGQQGRGNFRGHHVAIAVRLVDLIDLGQGGRVPGGKTGQPCRQVALGKGRRLGGQYVRQALLHDLLRGEAAQLEDRRAAVVEMVRGQIVEPNGVAGIFRDEAVALLGLPQRGLGAFDRGDIFLQGDVMGDHAGLVGHRGDDGPLNIDCAVFPLVGELATPHLAARNRGPHVDIDRRGGEPRLQHAGILPEDLLEPIARVRQESRVDVLERAVEVSDGDGERRLLDRAGELAQFRLRPFPFRDVFLERDEVRGPPARIGDRGDDGQLGEHLPVFLAVDELAAPDPALGNGAPEVGVHLRRGQARLQEAWIFPDHLRLGVAGEFGEARVHIFDGAREVGDHDGGRALLDREGELAQLGFGALGLGDVAPDRRDAVAPLQQEAFGAHAHIAPAAIAAEVAGFKGGPALCEDASDVAANFGGGMFGLDVAEAKCGEFFAGVAEALVCGAVELQEFPGRHFEERDGVRRLADNIGEDFLAGLEGILGGLARGDVEPIADQFRGAPLRVARDPHLVVHPTPGTVGVAEAVFAGDRGLVVQIRHRRQGRGHVVGMQMGRPEAGVRHDRSRFIAQHVADIGAEKGGREICAGARRVDDGGGRREEELQPALAGLEGRLRRLAPPLPGENLERKRDVARRLLEQFDFLGPEEVLFRRINGQQAQRHPFLLQGQGDGGLEAGAGGALAPGRGVGIGKEIVGDIDPVLPKGRAAGAAALGQIGVRGNPQALGVAGRVPGGRHGFDEARLRIEPAHPGDPKAAGLHEHAADLAKEFFAGFGAHEGLVDLADDEVEPVQPFDFQFVGLALGDVADDGQDMAATGQHHRPGAHLHREGRAVLPAVDGLEGYPGVLGHRGKRRLRGLLPGAQITRRELAQLLRGVAVGRDRPLVGFDDAQGLVEEEDGVVGMAHHDGQSLRRGAALALGLEPLGDVIALAEVQPDAAKEEQNQQQQDQRGRQLPHILPHLRVGFALVHLRDHEPGAVRHRQGQPDRGLAAVIVTQHQTAGPGAQGLGDEQVRTGQRPPEGERRLGFEPQGAKRQELVPIAAEDQRLGGGRFHGPGLQERKQARFGGDGEDHHAREFPGSRADPDQQVHGNQAGAVLVQILEQGGFRGAGAGAAPEKFGAILGRQDAVPHSAGRIAVDRPQRTVEELDFPVGIGAEDGGQIAVEFRQARWT